MSTFASSRETTEGTIYRAMVRHMKPEDAQAHAKIGFEAGWNAALDQLLALLRR